MGNLDIILGLILLLGYTAFAYYTRNVKTFEEFAIGNQNISLPLIFASISATFIGPGFTLGLTHKGFDSGLFFLLIILGYALQLFVVGRYIAPRIRKKFNHNTYSIGDIIGGENSHNNKGLRIISGIIAFGLILGFSVVMTSAIGDLLVFFFDIPKIYGVAGFTAFVAIYSYTGGIKASIYTDALQFGIFIIIIPLLLAIIIKTADINLTDLYDQTKSLTSLGYAKNSGWNIFGLVISFTLGEMLLPPLVARILASKTPKISSKAFQYSSVFLVLWLCIMFCLGIVGSIALDSKASDTILLELGQEFLPTGLIGVFIVAMIGVIISSQDSLINYAATIFTRDIIRPVDSEEINSDKKQLKMSKLSTLMIAVFSLVFAIYVPSVLEGLLLCYTIWIPSILVSLLCSIFLEKPSIYGAYISIFSGLTISLTWQFSRFNDYFPTILIGLTASILGYIIGKFIQK